MTEGIGLQARLANLMSRGTAPLKEAQVAEDVPARETKGLKLDGDLSVLQGGQSRYEAYAGVMANAAVNGLSDLGSDFRSQAEAMLSGMPAENRLQAAELLARFGDMLVNSPEMGSHQLSGLMDELTALGGNVSDLKSSLEQLVDKAVMFQEQELQQRLAQEAQASYDQKVLEAHLEWQRLQQTRIEVKVQADFLASQLKPKDQEISLLSAQLQKKA